MKKEKEQTIRLQLVYFASLREICGKNKESCVFPAGIRIREIYDNLKERYRFSYEPEELKAAVNDSYVSFDTVPEEGDCLVFIPPVAGG